MIIRSIPTALVLLVLAPALFAQTSTIEKKETTTSTATPTAQPKISLGAVLSKPVDKVEWDDVTFEFVLEWVREQSTGINVIAAWGPLGVESVNQEKAITLHLTNTNVAEVLNETMVQLSEEGNVIYRGIDNTIRISTKDDFNRKLYVKVYDMADILMRVPDFGRGAPRIDIQQQGNQGGGGGGGGGSGGQSIFGQGGGGGGGAQNDQESQGGQQAERELIVRLTELSTLIKATIAPDHWDTAQGKGTIQPYNRSLVIKASIEVHEEITGRFTFD